MSFDTEKVGGYRKNLVTTPKTLAMGLPVTGWDRKLQKIIKQYPDGRIEDVKNSKVKNG